MDWNLFKQKNPDLETLEISYNGSGDSGNMEVETDFRGEFHESLDSWAYDFLEDRVGGWEINEGSEGTIKINLKTNQIEWNHGNIVEIVEWEKTTENLTE